MRRSDVTQKGVISEILVVTKKFCKSNHQWQISMAKAIKCISSKPELLNLSCRGYWSGIVTVTKAQNYGFVEIIVSGLIDDNVIPLVPSKPIYRREMVLYVFQCSAVNCS